MGLLKNAGKPLTWEEAANQRSYVREHGIIQFLKTYYRVKDTCCQELLWGDELEYGIFIVDKESKNIKLSCRGSKLLEELSEKEKSSMHRCEGCTWHPEYGAWMVEATPRNPFSGYAADLLRVERNMRLRRKRILSVLLPNEIAPTVTCLPTMGVLGFASNCKDVNSDNLPPLHGAIANSKYIPDCIINPHPRFGALTANIRSRKGKNVDIRLPLFRDENTKEFNEFPKGDRNTFESTLKPILEEKSKDAGENFEINWPEVDMDAMAFGMGCCCLQVTFQGRDIDESRFMYDQLAVLSPIMLALSAASPIFKGHLVDTDVRWKVISASVDDRTNAELGLEEGVPDPTLVGNGIKRLFKSRYDSISTYLHYCRRRVDNPMYVLDTYDDIDCEVDEEAQKILLENGIDPALAKHIAHLFSRDPLVIYERGIKEVDDETETDHFENLQSTNWQTVRWKPPPPKENPSDPQIGWRTEFRSMEVQLTDLENAAFTVFVVLVTRVILAFDLNLYIPLSKVDENMKRAHERNAIGLGRSFYWRMHMAPRDENSSSDKKTDAPFDGNLVTNGTAFEKKECNNGSHDYNHDSCSQDNIGFEEMTVNEIMMGKGDHYPGLIPLVFAYLEHIGCDAETSERVEQYMDLIKKRACGELPTAASWMRNFVTSHSEYNKDSVVSPSIAMDLMIACKEIGEGHRDCPELLGDLRVRPVLPETGYDVRLDSSKVSRKAAIDLISKYTNRNSWNEKNLPLPYIKSNENSARKKETNRKNLRKEREPSISLY
mmetsp:Transcript_4773/g.7223  ORF Transcript_4773/g.7223 Transcript_4773/m.7223 type:complete len:774 (+) Transcript_4773:57-2378(+)